MEHETLMATDATHHIDPAIGDYETPHDAMRWNPIHTPPETPREICVNMTRQEKERSLP